MAVSPIPTISWAKASLTMSLVGWLFGVLCILGNPWSGHAESAGVGGGAVALVGCACGLFCCLGAILGSYALLRIRAGMLGGRIVAWTGIILGALPLPVGIYVLLVPGGLMYIFQ